MCLDKASRELQQSQSNGAAQTILMPRAHESFSWYCRMCQKAAHCNGNMETPIKVRLSTMLNLMRDAVYRNLALVREACACENLVQQRISQLGDDSSADHEAWLEAMLADAVQSQTITLGELQFNTQKTRQLSDEAATLLEKYAHVD